MKGTDYMKELLELFLAFCRIGGFTFGGGMAMLPMLRKEIVEKYRWATDEELLDYYAIGQCTPGIIAVNTATFIGYKRKGIIGAIVATAGVVSPSIVVITLIAAFFTRFQDLTVVQQAFRGIRAAVTALIFNTILNLYSKSVKDWLGIFVFFGAFLLVAFMDVSPIVVVIICCILGIVNKRVRTDVQ